MLFRADYRIENKKEMGHIIIQNDTAFKDEVILPVIIKIIEKGRISKNNTQYCHLTTFKINGEKYYVSTELRKKSDVFTIGKLLPVNEESI